MTASYVTPPESVDDSITFTTLLRNPKNAARRAEEGPVHIRRRDGADLVLVSADNFRRSDAGIEDAVRLLDAMERTDSFGEAVELAFPWVEWLTDAGREDCVDDLHRKLRAAASVGKYRGFGLAVGSWRGTAEALADGIDRDEDLGMYTAEDLPPVPRPE
jgi:hypothetical protein